MYAVYFSVLRTLRSARAMMRGAGLWTAVIAGLLPAWAGSPGRAADDTSLVIVYTNNTNGQLEACG